MEKRPTDDGNFPRDVKKEKEKRAMKRLSSVVEAARELQKRRKIFQPPGSPILIEQTEKTD